MNARRLSVIFMATLVIALFVQSVRLFLLGDLAHSYSERLMLKAIGCVVGGFAIGLVRIIRMLWRIS